MHFFCSPRRGVFAMEQMESQKKKNTLSSTGYGGFPSGFGSSSGNTSVSSSSSMYGKNSLPVVGNDGGAGVSSSFGGAGGTLKTPILSRRNQHLRNTGQQHLRNTGQQHMTSTMQRQQHLQQQYMRQQHAHQAEQAQKQHNSAPPTLLQRTMSRGRMGGHHGNDGQGMQGVSGGYGKTHRVARKGAGDRLPQIGGAGGGGDQGGGTTKTLTRSSRRQLAPGQVRSFARYTVVSRVLLMGGWWGWWW